MSECNMGWATVLKLAAVGVCLIVALQVIFYYVFQIIGYSYFWINIILIVSVLVFIVILISWRALKNALAEQTS